MSVLERVLLAVMVAFLFLAGYAGIHMHDYEAAIYYLLWAFFINTCITGD